MSFERNRWAGEEWGGGIVGVRDGSTGRDGYGVEMMVILDGEEGVWNAVLRSCVVASG